MAVETAVVVSIAVIVGLIVIVLFFFVCHPYSTMAQGGPSSHHGAHHGASRRHSLKRPASPVCGITDKSSRRQGMEGEMNVDIEEATVVGLFSDLTVFDTQSENESEEESGTEQRPGTRNEYQTQGCVFLGKLGETIITQNLTVVKLIINEEAMQRLTGADPAQDPDRLLDGTRMPLSRLEWNRKQLLEKAMTSFCLTLENELMPQLLGKVCQLLRTEQERHEVQRLAQELLKKHRVKLCGIDVGSLIFILEHASVEDAQKTLKSAHRQEELQNVLLLILPEWVPAQAVWTVTAYTPTAGDAAGLENVTQVPFIPWAPPVEEPDTKHKPGHKEEREHQEDCQPGTSGSVRQPQSAPEEELMKKSADRQTRARSVDEGSPLAVEEAKTSTRSSSTFQEEEESPQAGPSWAEDVVADVGSSSPQAGSSSKLAEKTPEQKTEKKKAGAVPEAVWMPFVHEHYPNLLSATNFIPPYHFNKVPQRVHNIAGETVIVRDNPPSSDPPQQPAVALPDPQVSGSLGLQYPRAFRNIRVQDKDQQDDRATQRCLSALSDLSHQVMMVISSLEFKKYLSSHTNPLHAAAIAQLPTTAGSSLPSNIKDGECDVIAIDLVHGIILGEIKSVGDSDYFRTGSTGQQTEMIVKQVQKAAEQLRHQEAALGHLVSDLDPIRITKTILLPNITSAQLTSALSASPPLLQTLCQVLFPPNDVTDITRAVGHCLCEDNLQQPDAWWQRLHFAGADPSMTEEIFIRLVARFCGPATTVDVPTAGPPRKVLRSWGQAVAETGLRLSSLVLTPAQVELLSRQPEPQYMYLQGPPGTGKTICLFLKALQWARQGQRVVVVSGNNDSRAVSLLLEEQLTSMVEPAAANIALHWGNIDDAKADVTRLQQQMGPGPFYIIVDEFGGLSSDIQWLEEVRDQLPDVTVWTAGIWTSPCDDRTRPQLPSWLAVQTLQECLRCPPTVTTLLQQSAFIQGNHILPYISPQHPVATQGPPVQQLQHEDQPGHDEGWPWECDTCADHVIDIVTNQLRVGQPDHGLQYRDVFILCGGGVPRAGGVMVQRLQGHGLPVRVTSDPPSEDDTRELALAVSDVIMVAHRDHVQGLERRVVIVMDIGGDVRPAFYSFPATSRCSGALYYIY